MVLIGELCKKTKEHCLHIIFQIPLQMILSSEKDRLSSKPRIMV